MINVDISKMLLLDKKMGLEVIPLGLFPFVNFEKKKKKKKEKKKDF